MRGVGGAANRFVATATIGFLDGALVVAGLAVGLRAADLTTLVLAGAFAAGVTAATTFLGGALVIADLAVGLSAADLATLVLPVGAFARVAAIVLADFFAAGLFIVFFAAATLFVFFVFFAIFVFPIICGRLSESHAFSVKWNCAVVHLIGTE
jgi:hypothetical protein